MVVRSNFVRHQFPVRATYFRHVLPHVRGFPTLRVLCVIRRLIRIRRAFPVTVLLRLPGVPGAAGASHVLRRLSSCMPRPVDSGGPPPACQCAGLVLPSGALKPSASATSASRSCTSTSGCAVTPAAYRMLCLRFAHLVRRGSDHDSAMDARLDREHSAIVNSPSVAPDIAQTHGQMSHCTWHILRPTSDYYCRDTTKHRSV